MDTAPSLADALAHLKAFRSTFNHAEPVDEESCLTADDLTVIIEHCERSRADEVADALGDLA